MVRKKKLDKINLAKNITSKSPDWNYLDLESKIHELVAKIRTANNLN